MNETRLAKLQPRANQTYKATTHNKQTTQEKQGKKREITYHHGGRKPRRRGLLEDVKSRCPGREEDEVVKGKQE